MHADWTQFARTPSSGNHTTFVTGPFGSGKTALLLERLEFLLSGGIPGSEILLLLPDQSACRRYAQAILNRRTEPMASIEPQTYYALARREVQRFWPLVARPAGFADPERRPTFLNYETAQHVMARIIAPLLDKGYFQGLAMKRQAIVSEILDNLNKAAVNGYSIREIEPRLVGAWTGEPGRRVHYGQVQECVETFRSQCLELGLVDLSLAVETFHTHLRPNPAYWNPFVQRYRHLLVDDLQETVPVAQDLIGQLLPGCDSALITFEPDAGYRVMLGVDPDGARDLQAACRQAIDLGTGNHSNADLRAFSAQIGRHLGQPVDPPRAGNPARAIAGVIEFRYRAEMIRAVADTIQSKISDRVLPGDIAVIAPYADGVLRFSLGEALQAHQIPFRVLQSHVTLNENPVARALVTLAAMAHPDWKIVPPVFAVAEMLAQVIPELDPIRARLLADRLYSPAASGLTSSAELDPRDSDRIGVDALTRYDGVCRWLQADREQGSPFLDHMLNASFDAVVAGSHLTVTEASACSRLIASAAEFRRVGTSIGITPDRIGPEFLAMVSEGTVVARKSSALAGAEWPAAVTLVAPVYTYLLSGRTAAYQFWLDVGSMNWWEPLYQPLTNPHVLSRQWPIDRPWKDDIDYETRNRNLYRLVKGLTERCRTGIYVCTSELEMTAERQDSPLLRAVQAARQEAP